MTARPALIALLALLSACNASAPQPQSAAAGHQPGEEAAVIQALDRYMTTISASDLDAQAALQTPDGMTYLWLPSDEGGMRIVSRSNAFWTDPSRKDGSVVQERYWSPTVMIRGAIAVVWAPYRFLEGGKTSHCGVDVFNFVKIDGKWLVSNSMWTVEPEACTELLPADTATLRPVD